MMSYFQDGGRDVISRRKLLPSGEGTVHLQHLAGARCIRRLPAINSWIMSTVPHCSWS